MNTITERQAAQRLVEIAEQVRLLQEEGSALRALIADFGYIPVHHRGGYLKLAVNRRPGHMAVDYTKAAKFALTAEQLEGFRTKIVKATTSLKIQPIDRERYLEMIGELIEHRHEENAA